MANLSFTLITCVYAVAYYPIALYNTIVHMSQRLFEIIQQHKFFEYYSKCQSCKINLLGLDSFCLAPAQEITKIYATITHALAETEGCSVAILDADRLFRAMDAKAR